jgi:hypothetical protein
MQQRNRRKLALKACLALMLCLALTVPFATAAGAQAKWGINKDAMTMQECRDRLALPAKDRPRSDDPEVNKDAMCRNMLSASARAPKKDLAAKPARASSQTP